MKCDEHFNSFPRKMLYKFTDPLNLVHEFQIKGPDIFKSLHFTAPDLIVNIQYTIMVVVVQGGKKRKRKSWDLKKGEMVDPRPHRQWVTELETNPRLSGQCSLYPTTLKQGLLEFSFSLFRFLPSSHKDPRSASQSYGQMWNKRTVRELRSSHVPPLSRPFLFLNCPCHPITFSPTHPLTTTGNTYEHKRKVAASKDIQMTPIARQWPR